MVPMPKAHAQATLTGRAAECGKVADRSHRDPLVWVDVPMPELSDLKLLELFQQGDHSAFEELVLRHRQICFSFIYRMVGNQDAAEDLFQDTWMKVLRNAHAYEPRAKFSTWLLQIARNTVLDYFKRENLRRHPSLDQPVGDDMRLGATLASSERAPETALSQSELIEALQECMHELSERHREALVMRLYHKLSYAEISQITGTPEGTVKYWVHEATKSLGVLLKARGIEDL